MDCTCRPEMMCADCADMKRIHALHNRHEARRKIVALKQQLRTEHRPMYAVFIRAQIKSLQAH